MRELNQLKKRQNTLETARQTQFVGPPSHIALTALDLSPGVSNDVVVSMRRAPIVVVAIRR